MAGYGAWLRQHVAELAQKVSLMQSTASVTRSRSVQRRRMPGASSQEEHAAHNSGPLEQRVEDVPLWQDGAWLYAPLPTSESAW